ncbi:MAG: hypothetical protein PHN56_01870 [Candidatus Nanoarchaeia archaeon]|nr:hypothetical protein [Candidatus Nanoarchaeia archaeon]
MKKCLICEILNGKEGYAKIDETKEFITFIDLNPNNKEIALIISKKHEICTIDSKNLENLILKRNKISNVISTKLKINYLMLDISIEAHHTYASIYPKEINEQISKKNILEENKEIISELIIK